MLHRVAIIDDGIGQVQRLNYLGDIQMKIEQGNSLVTTVCMDCAGLPTVQGVVCYTISIFGSWQVVSTSASTSWRNLFLSGEGVRLSLNNYIYGSCPWRIPIHASIGV